MATKTFCDRCGRENRSRYSYTHFEVPNNLRYDLCPACVEDFKAWLVQSIRV